MSYTPTTWQSGDVITSTKLNKLEQGVAGNILIVDIINVGWLQTDKTYGQIYDALNNGVPVYVRCSRHPNENDYDDGFFQVKSVYRYYDSYRMMCDWISVNYAGPVYRPCVAVFEADGIEFYMRFVKKYYVGNSYVTVDTTPDFNS